MRYCNFLDGHIFSVNSQHGKGDLLVKLSPAAAAGIEPEPAARILLRKIMRMAENHHVDTGQVLRRDFFQPVDDFLFIDVTAVNDGIAAGD